MTAFQITLNFTSETEEKDAQYWLAELIEKLPVGTTGKIEIDPEAVVVGDLGKEHEGRRLTITRKDSKLDGIYSGTVFGVTNQRFIILDDRVHEVHPYEVVAIRD